MVSYYHHGRKKRGAGTRHEETKSLVLMLTRAPMVSVKLTGLRKQLPFGQPGFAHMLL
jgi:hypothetical protein